ncbi:MAG: hypothetical protein ACKPKO_45000 [Candidatus Fonsibacter sp.]
MSNLYDDSDKFINFQFMRNYFQNIWNSSTKNTVTGSVADLFIL